MAAPITELVIIPARFSGPVGTGNGGYVSGVAAAPIAGPATGATGCGSPVEVTLRRPVPLETPVERRVTADGVELVLDGEVLAEAVPVAPSGGAALPTSPGLDAARSAREGFPWRDEHAFPTCFSCGIERPDGLRIHCGPLGDGRFAADWVPDPTLDDGHGRVRPELVWAALDCPTAVPVVSTIESAPSVLGRLRLQQLGDVRVGDPHVVVSWGEGHEGRKRFGAAALYTAGGELLASSRAIWIELRREGA